MSNHPLFFFPFFFFSSRRRHTRLQGDWSSDVCSSDLDLVEQLLGLPAVQLGAWRDGPGDVVVASGGQGAWVGVDADGVHYEPLLGDPLDLGPERSSLGDRELLGRSRRAAFPDAPRQLVQLFSSARTGDEIGRAHV